MIVESIAAGKIIIGSSSGAIPEVMKNLGLSDFVFREGDQNHLLEKINYTINLINNGQIKEIIKKAQEKVVNLYSHQAVANRLYHYITSNDLNYGLIYSKQS